jgi:biopolymer transport protein ExbB
MAGGVSKATLPTMAGMVVALSGVFVSIYLNSASEKHETDLRELIKREL